MADELDDDGLEPSDEDSESLIKAPQEPEVNPEVYEATIEMVTRGFLTAHADINGILFVFKSLNHHELDVIRLMTGAWDKASIPPRFWDVFLAHMVLFVDGQNVLSERGRTISVLADTFRELPNAARVKLIRQLSELNRKATQATILVEAYATEPYSRWRWAQTQGLDLSTPALTGIEGTERLGLSYAQLSWRAINHYEDIRHHQDSDWENAKFIGGCFAGKGIQKVYNRDANRRKKEREERWTRKDLLLRHVLFGESLDTNKRYDGAQVVIVANTVEELASQVERSLKGEKDWHDNVVQEYEQGIRNNTRHRAEQLQSLVKERQQQMGDKDVVGATNLTGLSPDQVRKLVVEQQRRAAEALEKSGFLDENLDPVMTKWGLMDDPLPTSDQPTDGAFSLRSQRNAGKPWRP